MDVPATCTSCGTAIPAGFQRCPGCGRVYGDANHCRSCNAYAAVRAVSSGYVCAACGAPRERLPGTVVQGMPPMLGGPGQPTKQWMKSVAVGGSAFGLKFLGAAVIGGSLVIAGIIGAISGGGLALIPAAVISLAGLGLGGLLWSWGAHASRKAESITLSVQELEILSLAERHGGELFATDVARGLGISLAEAEARLSAMTDGTRIIADVTAEGLLRFEFRELRLRRSVVATRVAAPGSEAASEHEIEATEAASKKRETGA